MIKINFDRKYSKFKHIFRTDSVKCFFRYKNYLSVYSIKLVNIYLSYIVSTVKLKAALINLCGSTYYEIEPSFNFEPIIT